MAQEPEVIQHELEETRHALAEKLEQIGEKISGTVETVSETVNEVTETVTNVTETLEGTVQAVAQTVSGTVESVKDTVSTVGEKAQETVENIKQAFNLSEQVRRHPWIWLGGSVATGFVVGKMLTPHRHQTPEAEAFTRGNGYHASSAESQPQPQESSRWNEQSHSEPAAESSWQPHAPSWLSGLLEQFQPELNKLKELALGTVFGVARDMIAHAVPESLKDQVQSVFNDFTEKAGGKPIQGSVLGDSEQESNQQSETNEGTASSSGGEKRGKATAGKNR
jgi:ElaB/YqjD/DUF883 family membrane-anchored ribosome-binding protein